MTGSLPRKPGNKGRTLAKAEISCGEFLGFAGKQARFNGASNKVAAAKTRLPTFTQFALDRVFCPASPPIYDLAARAELHSAHPGLTRSG